MGGGGGGTENLGGGGGGGENIGGGVLGGGDTLSATIGPIPARAISIPHSHARSLMDPDYFLYIQYYTQQTLCLA